FARYLCQQITNDLPDKFGSSDESDDDEDGWMGDDFDRDDFEMRGSFGNSNMLEGDPFESRRSSLGDDFGADSDDEDSSSQWPSSNIQEHKQLLTIADWSADFQSGFKAPNTTQISDSATTDQSYATNTFVSTNRQSNASSSISNLAPKETNVQQSLTLVNIIKENESEKDSDVKGSMETSIHITS
ncbi:10051_t:CDS:2, partial [Acaulospora morrowiae]